MSLEYPVTLDTDGTSQCVILGPEALERAITAVLGAQALPFKVLDRFGDFFHDCQGADGVLFTLSPIMVFDSKEASS